MNILSNLRKFYLLIIIISSSILTATFIICLLEKQPTKILLPARQRETDEECRQAHFNYAKWYTKEELEHVINFLETHPIKEEYFVGQREDQDKQIKYLKEFYKEKYVIPTER